MTNLAHIAETALLLLLAYLLGCILGYAGRRILHAGRATRQVATPPAAIARASSLQPRSARSSAAGLAATVPDPSAGAVVPIPREVSPVPAAPPIKLVPRARAAGAKPPALAQPRHGQSDNLMQIKGIGPKIEASLHAIGVFHIDQIAGWTKPNVEWVDAELACNGRIRRERWVEQAQALNQGPSVARGR